MTKDDCFQLGHVAKAHGYKGQVSIKIEADDPSYYNGIDACFLEINQQLVPHFIEQFEVNNRGFATVTFEMVDTEAKAKSLSGKPVYLPITALPKLKDNQFYYHEVIGYKIVDQQKGDCGIITDIIDETAQPVFVINYKEKEVLIPIVDDFIVKVDKPNRTITLNSPEGLIDLYLE